MARMHSRDKGTSGSTKPSHPKVPSWMGYKQKEIDLLVGKLGKDGMSSSQIGIFLRDNYGIPDVKLITGKRISQILQDKKLLHELPEDLRAIIKKALLIRKHLSDNHKDQTAKRGLQLTESKVKRLAKYYIKTKKLPADWKYDPKKASRYVE